MSAPAVPLRTARPGQLARAVAVGLAGGGAALLLHVIDPTRPGSYPACPTWALTGWYCPGCGALRALHHLTEGDLGAAWAMNPLVVLAVPWLVWTWSRWLYRAGTGTPRHWAAPGALLLAVAAAITAFGILRNVPGFEVLAPH